MGTTSYSSPFDTLITGPAEADNFILQQQSLQPSSRDLKQITRRWPIKMPPNIWLFKVIRKWCILQNEWVTLLLLIKRSFYVLFCICALLDGIHFLRDWKSSKKSKTIKFYQKFLKISQKVLFFSNLQKALIPFRG